MARRVVSVVSDDSQKENSGVRTTSKSGKMKERETRTRRSARRRLESEEEEPPQEEPEQEEEDSDAGGDEAPEEGRTEDGEDGASPKGRKRVRVNANGDSRPADVKPKKEEQVQGQTLPRDVDGFIPGSIVRIQLKNFVTYDFVEFRPGPYMNMIFGPNGTGKSTIACAICLGLNFPPSVLGRASDLNSFVKIGTDSGHIEIELKGPKGKSNLVIRRTLSAKSKSSTFTLDGQSATGKEINGRMRELNVQVSNLCTFLPQDKVSEFAQMTPQQLLRETQRAAGNSNLTAWHDTLISSGKELKQLQELVTADQDQLKTMQERNANLERDVRRYEERRQIEKDIELLELMLPFKEYVEAKDRYTEAKNKQRKLHERVLKLQAKNAPITQRKQALEAELRDVEAMRNRKKDEVRKKFDKMKKRHTENEKLETKSEELKTQLENLKAAEKTRLRDIARLEKGIAAMQEELTHPPKTEDLESLNKHIKDIGITSLGLKNRLSDVQAAQKRNVEEDSRHKANIDHNSHNLKQLDDASHRKLQDLAKWDPDAGEAVRWLRANRHKFQMEIFEPPMISVTVPDKPYVHAVESCFGASQLKTFVAQCEEDYALFNRLLLDTPDAVGKRLRLHTWFRKKDERQLLPSPMTDHEMREVGFDGYALQYIQCPEGLKWFLTSAMNLHRVAIAVRPNGVDPKRAMELVSRVGPRGEGGGANYVIGNIFNSVSRSKYGKRLPQNSTREIRPARNLVHTAVDQSVKRRFETAINEAREALQVLSSQAEQLTKDEAAIRSEEKELKSRYDAVQKRKTTVLETQKRLTNLRLKCERDEAKLDELRAKPPVDVERPRLKEELLSIAKKRAELAKDVVRLLRDAIRDQEEATRLTLRHAQIASNKTALETLVNEKEEAYRKALAEYQEAHRRYEVAKQDSKSKLDVSKQKLNSVNDEIRARFQEMEQSGEAGARSAEDIETELDAKRAQLEMSLHTNAGVIEQYRRRQAEIETLSGTIGEREKRVKRIERQIKTARDNWQPALEELVGSIGQRFSAAFDRLGCAGEIRISPHEDYDKWAIDILVKFRDHEQLQLLTGERQSGGERSLTTILYLMSLTEEARAPFSLVDEINQGMDQRAERAVHNSLVDVTCKADSGQYFLITPKLLPDLNYAERMKVLCVNNGEWLPEESGIGNMMNLIEAYVHHGRSKASM